MSNASIPPDLKLSVVIATYNRGSLLRTLMDDLAQQDVAPEAFEVIVVDDGSNPAAASVLALCTPPFQLTCLRQNNAGAAAARHAGILKAVHPVVVIVDDDMRLPSDFLRQHALAHQRGAQVVLGHIMAAPQLQKMPLFERFHAAQLARFAQAVQDGKQVVRGVDVCTGNVSLRRALYMRLGGFDTSLGRSEDRDLGIRCEKSGAPMVFAPQARSVHGSDHHNLQVWLRRAFLYGRYDRRIAQKHPEVLSADPWQFWELIHPLSRGLVLLPLSAPRLGHLLAWGVMSLALLTDRFGYEQLAIKGTTLGYGLEYFRGLRVEAGSWRGVAQDVYHYIKKKRAA